MIGLSIEFHYKNYRGEESRRIATIIGTRYGKSEHHPEDQLLIAAIDYPRGVIREFAAKDMARIAELPTE